MKVDNRVCLHCGACVGICPPNALFLHETQTIEFLDHCTECGLCVWVCPVGAIDFGASPVKRAPGVRTAGGNGHAASRPNGSGGSHGATGVAPRPSFGEVRR